jgi:hypothetical protein
LNNGGDEQVDQVWPQKLRDFQLKPSTLGRQSFNDESNVAHRDGIGFGQRIKIRARPNIAGSKSPETQESSGDFGKTLRPERFVFIAGGKLDRWL